MNETAQFSPLQDEVTAAIIEIVRKDLGVQGDVSADKGLVSDLALDSLGLMTLIVSLEDRFQIIFNEEEAPAIATIADLAAHVAMLRGRPC